MSSNRCRRENGRVAVSCTRATVCTSLRAWRSREGDTANCKIQIFRTLRSKRDENFETFEFCSWQCPLLFFFMHITTCTQLHVCTTQLHGRLHVYIYWRLTLCRTWNAPHVISALNSMLMRVRAAPYLNLDGKLGNAVWKTKDDDETTPYRSEKFFMWGASIGFMRKITTYPSTNKKCEKMWQNIKKWILLWKSVEKCAFMLYRKLLRRVYIQMWRRVACALRQKKKKKKSSVIYTEKNLAVRLYCVQYISATSTRRDGYPS